MDNQFKYNFVILGGRGYYQIGYQDVKSLPNVRYFSSIYDGQASPLTRKLTRFTFSKEVNKHWRLPFKSFTFSHIFPIDFPDYQPICFLFFRSYYRMSHEYIKYLKNKYRNSRFVLYFQDRVDLIKDYQPEEASGDFDLIYSYNMKDCEEYGLIYHPTPYSRYNVPTCPDIAESDIFFCGKAKTRYESIFSAYRVCQGKGLNCDFYVADVPDGVKVPDDIHVNEHLTYLQYLQHLTKSKIVLDIMQEGVDGYTPRVWESIMFDKHLLTNSKELPKSAYYNASYMHDLDNCLTSVKGLLSQPVEYSDEAKLRLSPINLLMDIERRIQ